MEEQLFKLQNAEGKEQLCRVVFTFDAEEHSYVLFTMIGENGEQTSEVSALRYILDENGEMADFQDIESDEEWGMVEEVMNTLIDEFSEDQTKFITITDEDGEEIVCEILYRFELPNSEKKYLFYGYADEEVEHQEIFASAYVADETGAVVDLLPIETEREWEQIEQVLASLQQGN